MRNNQEIENEFVDIVEGGRLEISKNDKLILEVLLDIRDLLRSKL